MPPSSRKRNKGKERKAKQQAKKEESDRANARKFWNGWVKGAECNHGCGVMIPADDHPVSNFMDQFIINFHRKDLVLSQNLREIFKSHRHIYNNESYRNLAIGILVNVGTNMILSDVDTSSSVCVAISVVVLEHFNGTGDIDSVVNSQAVTIKRRDFDSDCSSLRRDVLKFFRKRISCKCLKKIHLEARKNKPKTGICWHCKKEKERAALSVCSRCMLEQYCSRECQVAHWSIHKKRCDIYVRAHQQHSSELEDT